LLGLVVYEPLRQVSFAISTIRQMRLNSLKLAGPVTGPIAAPDFKPSD